MEIDGNPAIPSYHNRIRPQPAETREEILVFIIRCDSTWSECGVVSGARRSQSS